MYSEDFDDSHIPYIEDEEENRYILERLKRVWPIIMEEIRRGEYITGRELLEKWEREGKVRIKLIDSRGRGGRRQ